MKGGPFYDRCWLYPGFLHQQKGYGVAKHQGKVVYVHRAVFEEVHGPLEPECHVDHHCPNKHCYNPFPHLGGQFEAVNNAENQRRRWARKAAA